MPDLIAPLIPYFRDIATLGRSSWVSYPVCPQTQSRHKFSLSKAVQPIYTSRKVIFGRFGAGCW